MKLYDHFAADRICFSRFLPSKMATFSLALFPDEILGCVLNRESTSYLILQLWKTGDSSLRQKLVRCMTKVDLRQAEHFSSSVPSLLLELRNLRSLSLYTYEFFSDTLTSFLDKLKALPKTLESITIFSEDSEVILLDGHDNESSTHNFADLGLPNLLKISLGSVREEMPALQLALFPGLPSTLTSLNIPKLCYGEGWSKFMSILPRTLRDLYTELTIKIGNIDQASAPPNLEIIRSIDCIGEKGSLDHPDTLDWLPSSITRSYIDTISKDFWTLQLARSMPPLFDSLYISKVLYSSFSKEPSWAASLPRSLTFLQLNHHPLPLDKDTGLPFLKLEDIAHLPRTLKTLISERYELFDWSSLRSAISKASWPPNLTKLGFCPSKLLIGDIGLLPSTLLHLTIFGLSKASSTLEGEFALLEGKLLPPRLETLSVLGSDISTCLKSPSDPEYKLPSRLRQVKFTCGEETKWLGLDGRNYGPPSDWNCLPDSLTKLRWRSNFSPEAFSGPPSFPSCLTKLNVGKWSDIDLKHLPRTLQSLKVDALLRTVPKAESWTLLEDIPLGIVSVVISCYLTRRPKIEGYFIYSPKSFTRLTHLQNLDVSLISAFTPEVLSHLPRSLRRLSILLSGLTAADLPNIPPQLRHMDLGPHIDFNLPSLHQYWPLRAVASIPYYEWQLSSQTRDRIAKEHPSEL